MSDIIQGRTVAEAMLAQGIKVPKAKKANKYNAVATVYNGVRYASKAEAAYAQLLDTLVDQERVSWWIGQPVFRLGVAENVYRADFLVVYGEGGIEAVDVKGKRTPKFNHDVKLWRRFGPCPLRIVGSDKDEVITREG